MAIRTTKRSKHREFHQRKTHVADITLNVPQGIGDVWWIYQKFSPYAERINFNVFITHNNRVQERAVEWLKLLPKVQNVGTIIASGRHITDFVKMKPHIGEVLNRWARTEYEVEYCCNKWLEDGVRLDAIDPDWEIEWNIDIKRSRFEDLEISQGYTVLFMCKGTKEAKDTWSLHDWERFCCLFLGDRKVIIIGAVYDDGIANNMRDRLIRNGFDAPTYFVGRSPKDVISLIEHASLFIGFQSGLNVIADNFNVPQLMMYFEYLEAMKTTWVHPDHVDTIFVPALFSESPEEVAKRLTRKEMLWTESSGPT